jgi:hypothetical protein
MAIKKILIFAVMVATCLATQFYDKHTGKFAKSSLDHIDLLAD